LQHSDREKPFNSSLLSSLRSLACRASIERRSATMSSKFGDISGGRGGRGKKRKLQQQRRAARALAIDRPVFLPQSTVYTSLLDFERDVDRVLAQKKAEVNESLKRVDRTQRTIRIYVYNTFKPERTAGVSRSKDGGEKTETDPGSWTLHVQGRLLGAGEPGDVSGGAETSNGNPNPQYIPKFGAFVDELHVTSPGTGKQSGGDDDAIDCRYESSLADPLEPSPDGFELKRVGSVDRRVQIKLSINHGVDLYKTHDLLSKTLGVEIISKPKLIRQLWRYVEAHKLHAIDDPAAVTVDETLGLLLKECGETVSEKASDTSSDTKSMSFETLAEVIVSNLLQPVPPLQIDYVVRTSGRKNPTQPDVYDVFVEVANGGVEEMYGGGGYGGVTGMLDSNTYIDVNTGRRLNGQTPPTKNHPFVFSTVQSDELEIENCVSRIEAGVKKITEHEQRRVFLLGFANNPGRFIDHVVKTQAQDMPVVRQDGSTTRKSERKTDLYKQGWVDEAVTRYVSGKK
tara:strand:- start:26073 stop:27611 length:1539 start_codon:yes stop_codon:yes gene_type:complete